MDGQYLDWRRGSLARPGTNQEKKKGKKEGAPELLGWLLESRRRSDGVGKWGGFVLMVDRQPEYRVRWGWPGSSGEAAESCCLIMSRVEIEHSYLPTQSSISPPK